MFKDKMWPEKLLLECLLFKVLLRSPLTEVGFVLSQIMGGVEPTLYRGSIWYTPIIEEWYYQVEVLRLEVGDQNLDLDCREVNYHLKWSLNASELYL